jgi:hypothetical protein
VADPPPGPGSAAGARPPASPKKGRPGKKPDPSAIKPRPEPAKADPTKPDTARPVDVGQKWQQVGAAINALKQSPATRAEGERLFARWNRIHPHTVQMTAQSRKQALAELDELQRLADQARSKP